MAAAPFLAGVGRTGPAPALVNQRTNQIVASSVEIAGTSKTRRRGLLGRDSLPSSAALIIAPCSSIHTFFMRFVIDVVFVDRNGRVRKVVRNIKPWRIAASLGAYAVIEMTGGAVAADLRVGDRLALQR